MSRLCQERLRLARTAIVQAGWFKPEEVSDDIAPRITEYHCRMQAKIREQQRQICALQKELDVLDRMLTGEVDA